jgi:hypothetical protein
MTALPSVMFANTAANQLTAAQLKRATAATEVVRLRRGAYLPAAEIEALDDLQRHRALIAATLPAQCWVDAICYVSAAVLHESPIWRIDLQRAHLHKPLRGAGRRHRVLHVHTTPLTPDEIVEVGGVRVTTVARTLLDIALSESFESAVVMVDDALHRKVVTRAELDLQIERSVRRHGRARAIRAFAFADGLCESVGESRSRVGMHLAGIPAPELQAEIRRADGSLVARVDFRWGRVIGEFDGMSKYGRWLRPGETAADAVVREKLREDELQALGFLVVRWTWKDLEDPAFWRRLQRVLEQAAA